MSTTSGTQAGEAERLDWLSDAAGDEENQKLRQENAERMEGLGVTPGPKEPD